MYHLLIAESLEYGRQHIRKMEPFFFRIANITHNEAIVLTHSGRWDNIKIIAHETHSRGHRVNGQILRTSNSTETDELFYYTRRDNPLSMKGLSDAETLYWHWATTDAYQGFGSTDHALARSIIAGLKAQER
jgi:hypothetical protein